MDGSDLMAVLEGRIDWSNGSFENAGRRQRQVISTFGYTKFSDYIV
jgi:hypothetical protein